MSILKVYEIYPYLSGKVQLIGSLTKSIKGFHDRCKRYKEESGVDNKKDR